MGEKKFSDTWHAKLSSEQCKESLFKVDLEISKVVWVNYASLHRNSWPLSKFTDIVVICIP